jgi:NAD(P)-dependent dehydrogenase (short-subunit alcohol dehydrogenase family)
MTNQMLKGKVAIVTGASRNLGRAISETLGAEGATVAIHYHSAKAKEEAEAAAMTVKAAGGAACVIQADLGSVKEVERLFAEVIERFGRLDILINNAGMIIKKPFKDITEEEYDRVFGVNAKAAFFCMREAAKLMNAGGRIVNVGTSILGMTVPHYSVYAGSKAPLEHFTRALAKEVTARGITVNTIAPGALDTPFFFAAETQESVELIKHWTGGLGKTTDVTPLVAFLVSPGAQWVTAQTIFVNGGFLAR